LWAERKEGIKYHQLIQYSLENCGLLSSPQQCGAFLLHLAIWLQKIIIGGESQLLHIFCRAKQYLFWS
jgi:hypothetical protein